MMCTHTEDCVTVSPSVTPLCHRENQLSCHVQEEEARRELEVTSQELLRCITALEGVTDEIEDLRSKNREADAYVARAKEAAETERRSLQVFPTIRILWLFVQY